MLVASPSPPPSSDVVATTATTAPGALTPHEAMAMMEAYRQRESNAVLRTELAQAKHANQLGEMREVLLRQQAVIDQQTRDVAELVAAAQRRTREQKLDDEYARAAMPRLYDLAWSDCVAHWPWGLVMSHGRHHWYSDPGLAVAFASSGGLLLGGFVVDLLLLLMWRIPARPNAPNKIWGFVRAGYTLWYAFLVSEFFALVGGVALPCDEVAAAAAAAEARPHVCVPSALWSATGALVGYVVTGEMGLVCAAASWLSVVALVAPGVLGYHPSAVVSAEFRMDTGAFWHFWVLVRVKNGVAWVGGGCVPSLRKLDGKWARPDPDADAAFYRRWSTTFFWFSSACGVVHVSCALRAVLSDPGWYVGGFAGDAIVEFRERLRLAVA